MNQTELDAEIHAQHEAIDALRGGIVQACNIFSGALMDKGWDTYGMSLMAIVAATADLIDCAPEEKQGEILRLALSYLETAYVKNLTKGNL
jgi:hypothetical protein